MSEKKGNKGVTGYDNENIYSYEKDIHAFIEKFTYEMDIKKEDITPLQWKSILIEINEKLIACTPTLLQKNITKKLEYDYIKLCNIYRLYNKLCLKYSFTTSLYDYCLLTGVSNVILYQLSNYYNDGYIKNDDYYIEKYGEKLTFLSLDLIKELQLSTEETLVSKLQEKGKNPMSVLPILNHRYNWNDTAPNSTKQVNIITTDSVKALLDLKNTQKSTPDNTQND